MMTIMIMIMRESKESKEAETGAFCVASCARSLKSFFSLSVFGTTTLKPLGGYTFAKFSAWRRAVNFLFCYFFFSFFFF